MVTRAIPKVTSWSFSRYMDYLTCPAKFKFKHLLKMSEPPNKYMERGADVHKKAEDYTTGKLKTMPAELKLFKEEFNALKKQKVKFIEDNWAFTKAWDLTQWNNWAECWLRVKLDAAYINLEHNALVVIDHKTGSMRDEKKAEYELQLELYGLAGLVQQPTVDLVSPRLWYLDHGVIYPEDTDIEYKRADEPKLKKKWEQRVIPMFADKQFKPKPNYTCDRCHYRKANGGPCVN